MMDEDSFFRGHPDALAIYHAVKDVIAQIGVAQVHVSKSQVSFSRAHPIAAGWRPGQHLRGDVPPLVLSVFMRRHDNSPRWKKIVEPRPGRFTHHMELRFVEEIDDEVQRILKEA